MKKKKRRRRSAAEVQEAVLEKILEEKKAGTVKQLRRKLHHEKKSLSHHTKKSHHHRITRQIKEPRETINKKPSRNFEIPRTSVEQIMIEKPRNPRTRLPIINEWNMLDFINRTGFHKDDILLECKFRGTDCYEDKFWKTVSVKMK